ncbi:MAG: DUF423 domain-containing protein [Alphaproteobacteria bacterium]|nr:DUF423 domain-containing protein [Alphaproteobacteria bacterium]
MNWRIFLAGANGFLAVAFAAFGAHGLPAALPDHLRHAYETGGEIHLVHAAALAALAFAPPVRRLTASFIAMLCGSILFAGSLYVYAMAGFASAAMIAPVGGTLLLIGWILLAAAGAGSKANR